MQKQDQSQKMAALFSELQQVASEAGQVVLLMPQRAYDRLEYFCENKEITLTTLCHLQTAHILRTDGNLEGEREGAETLVNTAYFAEQILSGLSISEYLPKPQNPK